MRGLLALAWIILIAFYVMAFGWLFNIPFLDTPISNFEELGSFDTFFSLAGFGGLVLMLGIFLSYKRPSKIFYLGVIGLLIFVLIRVTNLEILDIFSGYPLIIIFAISMILVGIGAFTSKNRNQPPYYK